MRVDKGIIDLMNKSCIVCPIFELMEKKGIVCPCIKQMHTDTWYPGFIQTIEKRFINIKDIYEIFMFEFGETRFYVKCYSKVEKKEICLALEITEKEDAEIILHEIMRIITMR